MSNYFYIHGLCKCSSCGSDPILEDYCGVGEQWGVKCSNGYCGMETEEREPGSTYCFKSKRKGEDIAIEMAAYDWMRINKVEAVLGQIPFTVDQENEVEFTYITWQEVIAKREANSLDQSTPAAQTTTTRSKSL